MAAGLLRLFFVSFFLVASFKVPVLLAADAGAGLGTSALRAYADPETGELVSPPAGTGGGAEAASAADPAQLEVVPAPSRAGGLMIDLRGQFLYATRAYATPDGAIIQQCAPQAAPGPEK